MMLSTMILASMHGLVRHAGTEIHPFVLIFYRNMFGLLVIIPLLLRTGFKGLHSSHFHLLFLRGFLGIFAMLAWFYSLVHVPITEATALSFTAAIFTALAAIVFLGERVRIRRWAAIAVGLIGVVVVLRPETENFDPLLILVLFSTLLWALSITLIKFLSRTDTALSQVAWMSILMTVLSLPFALYYWQWPVGEQWLWLIAIGVLGTLGQLCMVQAISLADTSLVMTIDFFRLIWGALIGYYFFADQMSISTWIGAIIIFSSGAYIIYRESAVQEQAPLPDSNESARTGKASSLKNYK
ncbi:MAG: drug/metabolite transporter (DMT)-like permease [Planctomycetota bacterium]|jgi:drug/metabolite transporter (DMT)-like permease